MGLLPNKIKSLILDMDGVLWKGDAPIGDLPTTFARIGERGLKVAFATNNGTRTPEQYIERLAGFGIKAQPAQVVTSALGVADLLCKQFPHGSKVFAIGGNGVMAALQEQGFKLLPVNHAEAAQVVVMGIDPQINFEKMCEATLLIRKGIPFFATNTDKTFPTPRGEIPGAGAWLSVVITATDVQPVFAGKPAPYLIELSRQRLGTSKDETLVVGDRLETDIAGGQAAGCPTALMLSGVSTLQQAQAWSPHIDLIAQDLWDLVS